MGIVDKGLLISYLCFFSDVQGGFYGKVGVLAITHQPDALLMMTVHKEEYAVDLVPRDVFEGAESETDLVFFKWLAFSVATNCGNYLYTM